jgi:hypothetical protein
VATVTSNIVTVNASVTLAPAPSTLQASGALISCGGSTLTANTYQYCGNLAAVTAILSATGNFVELTAMATTYFAQGSAVGVYVLEIGAGGGASATQIAALTTWLTNNPGVFYAFLNPATWDTTSSAAVQTLAATYASATGATYFFQTGTTANLANYTAKSLHVSVKSPTAASTEFQAAYWFYQWLSNATTISTSSPASPMAFRFASGVTPWAFIQSGGTSNVPTINTILTAFANIILTGAEGNISNAMGEFGTFMDGNQMMFWWAVDFLVINSHVNLANAVINGSQPGQPNPLVYNQFGINTLLAVLNALGATGTSEQIFLAYNFTATPFITYTNANPANYAAGIYGGFQGAVTPQLGFEKITFNVAATTFV